MTTKSSSAKFQGLEEPFFTASTLLNSIAAVKIAWQPQAFFAELYLIAAIIGSIIYVVLSAPLGPHTTSGSSTK